MGVAVFAIGAQSASAADNYGNAKLVISNRPGEHVTGLTWKNFNFPVHIDQKGDERRAYVQLQGALDRTDSDLVFNDQRIPIQPNAEGTGATFSQSIQLTGKITLLQYHFVDPYGQTQTEKVVVVFPDWSKFNLPSKGSRPPRRWLMSAALGLSYENYSEPGNIQMTEFALTPKFNIVYLLKPNEWELGANTFVNALPFDNSPSNRAEARWWGINGRVGYRLPINSIPSTNVWLMTGWYAWGMYVNADQADTYGIAYLGGPQIFLTARITPAGKKASWVYLKYASIQDHLAIFSLTNRELAIGAGMEISERGAKHPVSLTLDYANAQATVATTDNLGNPITQSFNLDSLTLGVSVGL